MVPRADSPKYSLNVVSPKLGSALRTIVEPRRTGKPGVVSYYRLMQEMPGDVATQEATLMGALVILHGMGLICIDADDKVGGTSRYACYALGSLSRFLSVPVPAASKPVDDMEREYLVSLTKALEFARVENAQVDHAPLHSRRIVNVLVKSRQIRRWKVQEVYLHVYHPQWKQYHLVGLSHKDDSRTDEQIVELAMQNQVGLMPDQYRLDPTFNPSEVTLKRISATSGALTEYTLRLIAVKEIRVRLRLQKWVKEKKFEQDWFRWFTWEEIRQRESYQGEPIMFSTPLVMEKVDLSSVPLSAPNAEDVRRDRIGGELGSLFTYHAAIALLVAIILVLVLRFAPCILSRLGRPSPELQNLANIAEILGIIITLGGFLIARIERSWG